MSIMKSNAGRFREFLAGAATITFAPSASNIRRRVMRGSLASDRDALAGDWKAIGGDMKRALSSAGR